MVISTSLNPYLVVSPNIDELAKSFVSPPLEGGDQPARLQVDNRKGDQTFYHPHLTSPIKGEDFFKVVIIELPIASKEGRTYKGWLECRVAGSYVHTPHLVQVPTVQAGDSLPLRARVYSS